jgi:hypothetical protein
MSHNSMNLLKRKNTMMVIFVDRVLVIENTVSSLNVWEVIRRGDLQIFVQYHSKGIKSLKIQFLF